MVLAVFDGEPMAARARLPASTGAGGCPKLGKESLGARRRPRGGSRWSAEAEEATARLLRVRQGTLLIAEAVRDGARAGVAAERRSWHPTWKDRSRSQKARVVLLERYAVTRPLEAKRPVRH